MQNSNGEMLHVFLTASRRGWSINPFPVSTTFMVFIGKSASLSFFVVMVTLTCACPQAVMQRIIPARNVNMCFVFIVSKSIFHKQIY